MKATTVESRALLKSQQDMSDQHHHCCHAPLSSVNQTIDEMEFERGIWSACLDGDHERVLQLLRAGKDASQKDSSGYEPLHYAARSGRREICETLLSRGASVNAQTRSGGSTGLHRAAYSGHMDVVRLLLTKGANVNTRDSDGKIPLHKACEQGEVDIAKLLLSKDPSTRDVTDNRGNRPEDCAKDKDKWTTLFDMT